MSDNKLKEAFKNRKNDSFKMLKNITRVERLDNTIDHITEKPKENTRNNNKQKKDKVKNKEKSKSKLKNK